MHTEARACHGRLARSLASGGHVAQQRLGGLRAGEAEGPRRGSAQDEESGILRHHKTDRRVQEQDGRGCHHATRSHDVTHDFGLPEAGQGQTQGVPDSSDVRGDARARRVFRVHPRREGHDRARLSSEARGVPGDGAVPGRAPRLDHPHRQHRAAGPEGRQLPRRVRGAHHHLPAGQRGHHPRGLAAGHRAAEPPERARPEESGDGAAPVPPARAGFGRTSARQVPPDAVRQRPERDVRGAVRAVRPHRGRPEAAQKPGALVRVHPEADRRAPPAQGVRLPPRAGAVFTGEVAEDPRRARRRRQSRFRGDVLRVVHVFEESGKLG
mmetsp:Transcript_3860/g.16402  ORF Transcript_3860/g.16402 Transcript_3860/m.16402 type:complete len:325 (+) Transcript_3860:3-977(+)